MNRATIPVIELNPGDSVTCTESSLLVADGGGFTEVGRRPFIAHRLLRFDAIIYPGEEQPTLTIARREPSAQNQTASNRLASLSQAARGSLGWQGSPNTLSAPPTPPRTGKPLWRRLWEAFRNV